MFEKVARCLAEAQLVASSIVLVIFVTNLFVLFARTFAVLECLQVIMEMTTLRVEQTIDVRG
jgi:hypothetical protein